MGLDLATKSTRKGIPDWLSSREKRIRVLLVQVDDVDDQRYVLVIGRGRCNIKRLIVCSDVDVVCWGFPQNYFVMGLPSPVKSF